MLHFNHPFPLKHQKNFDSHMLSREFKTTYWEKNGLTGNGWSNLNLTRHYSGNTNIYKKCDESHKIMQKSLNTKVINRR